jgi:transcriptional regulator with XRE-family HTH domain
MATMSATYDGATGTAGGPAFGTALAALAAAQQLDPASLAERAGLDAALVAGLVDGTARAAAPALARLARALKLRAIEFMQKTGLLSLEVYAFGLDPLYFLPDGTIRHDARIYMREINPRHAVPEGDMTKRNPALRAVADDELLDALGKSAIEFTYLLQTAAAAAGGRL